MQENVKKCKNFLATLIKLASHNSPSPETSKNVKALVQDLLVSFRNQQTDKHHGSIVLVYLRTFLDAVNHSSPDDVRSRLSAFFYKEVVV